MVKRQNVRGILQDAINDREAYVDACRGIPEYVEAAEAEMVAFKDLSRRYYSVGRFAWTPVDRETFRVACIRALSWRDSFLDSIRDYGDKPVVASAKSDVRVASTALEEFGGDAFAKLIENSATISLWDLAKSDIGTRIESELVDGVEKRVIKENGVLLGVVTKDADGTVRATLADGSIANEPFEDIFEAQRWVLDRLSTNLVMRSSSAMK